MSTTAGTAGAPPSECSAWQATRTPPIAAGALDSVELLRFETSDAITLAEDVLDKTRALQTWLRSLPERHASADLPGPPIDDEVRAVAGADLSTDAVEWLLLALDELAGRLEAESQPLTNKGRRS
ncbi:hypothetical protein [Aquipuribacter nitratireducens]|uniref:Uncharacterized protein n=1 Tax=Aquipuribacter nitratireducens TaxID=650104 RepID=A0ABW0GVG2_9MICO